MDRSLRESVARVWSFSANREADLLHWRCHMVQLPNFYRIHAGPNRWALILDSLVGGQVVSFHVHDLDKTFRDIYRVGIDSVRRAEIEPRGTYDEWFIWGMTEFHKEVYVYQPSVCALVYSSKSREGIFAIWEGIDKIVCSDFEVREMLLEKERLVSHQEFITATKDQ